jgi:hypothetical protein
MVRAEGSLNCGCAGAGALVAETPAPAGEWVEGMPVFMPEFEATTGGGAGVEVEAAGAGVAGSLGAAAAAGAGLGYGRIS